MDGCTKLRHLVGRWLIRLQERYRLANELGLVVQTVEVGADFNVVPAMPRMCRKVEVRQTLHSACPSIRVQIIVASRRQRGQDVGAVALRSQCCVVLIDPKAGFKKRTATQIVLVFE